MNEKKKEKFFLNKILNKKTDYEIRFNFKGERSKDRVHFF